MERLHLPDNIKIHYAGCENQKQYLAAYLQGVRYGLYTCYPFVERKVFAHVKSPLLANKDQSNPAVDIPKRLCNDLNHVIQDSGLFTLMFGSQKSVQKNTKLIGKWYDALVEFTLEHGAPVTCVECDCQKLFGVDLAWEFRERMKKDLPNRQINVFHMEDGKDGLDRLIEFSDYIAISVPELRFANKKGYVISLARYIKKRKPSIDIHLLGCTELSLLKECRFCTSADSTTWISPNRYGYVQNKHVSRIDIDKVKQMVGEDNFGQLNAHLNDRYTAALFLNVEILKKQYQEKAGNQDYYSKL